MIKYFSAEARSRRARARERFNLSAELREMTLQRRYYDAREPYIMERLRVLDVLDSGKYTEATDKSPAVAPRGEGAGIARQLPTSRIIEEDARPPEPWGYDEERAADQNYFLGLRGLV